MVQRRDCSRNVKIGSTTIGYDASASRHPKLLAEYRKYGSRPEGWSVRDSQCWKTDALVERTKKGRPIVPASSSMSHPSGLPSGGRVTDPAWIMKGSTAAGAYPRMQWSLHIRAYGAPADAFVYQGTAQSKLAITSVRETSPAFQSMFEDGLIRLMAHFDGQRAYERLSRTGR